jgi:soluble lytic murein transglycosylase-like protein
MLIRSIALSAGVLVALAGPSHASESGAGFEGLVARHAAAQGIPAALIHRVIRSESNYNARAAHGGNYGLMQIRYATARGMGYGGPVSGLLDANTNLSVAVPYLANAYRVAGGNQDRAIRFYRSGFYYAAKRRGLLGRLRSADSVQPEPAAAPAPTSLFAALFGSPAPAAEPAVTLLAAADEPTSRRHRHVRRHRA